MVNLTLCLIIMRIHLEYELYWKHCPVNIVTQHRKNTKCNFLNFRNRKAFRKSVTASPQSFCPDIGNGARRKLSKMHGFSSSEKPEKGPWVVFYSLNTSCTWAKSEFLCQIFVFRAEMFTLLFPCTHLHVNRTSEQKYSTSNHVSFLVSKHIFNGDVCYFVFQWKKSSQMSLSPRLASEGSCTQCLSTHSASGKETSRERWEPLGLGQLQAPALPWHPGKGLK